MYREPDALECREGAGDVDEVGRDLEEVRVLPLQLLELGGDVGRLNCHSMR